MRNLLLKYGKTGTVEDQPKCGRQKKLTERAKTTMSHLCNKDQFRHATSITEERNVNYSTSVSVSTVKRTLADFGMHGRIAVREPFLSAANRKNRLQFALENKDGTVEDWGKIIFSDESKFNLYKSDGHTYVRRNSSKTLNPCCIQQTVSKHGGGSVMVWGAFTFLKLSTLPRISHRLDAQGYIQLLKDNLLPFLKEFPPGERVFQQDNAPIHTAKAMVSFLVSNCNKIIKWPPQSLDQNPIEHLWNQLD